MYKRRGPEAMRRGSKEPCVTNRDEPGAVRLAHFSDIHVIARGSWRPADLFNKRFSAWINLRLLGRARRFRHADAILAALVEDLRTRAFDRVVFSGDASALGFKEEVARAAELLGVSDPQRLHGLAVPGNHDYCTHADVRAGHFEHHFAPWLAGERVEGHTYPFAQRVGHAWLVAVNSSTTNRWAWDASGGVGREQRRRLEELLARLQGGPRILVTHYPVRRPCGRPERRSHALRDVDDVVAVARRGGVGLWLHGHCHAPYHLTPSADLPFPVVCAGSATQSGRWSYTEHTLTGHRLHVLHRTYDPAAGRFRDDASFELELP